LAPGSAEVTLEAMRRRERERVRVVFFRRSRTRERAWGGFMTSIGGRVLCGG